MIAFRIKDSSNTDRNISSHSVERDLYVDGTLVGSTTAKYSELEYSTKSSRWPDISTTAMNSSGITSVRHWLLSGVSVQKS